MSKYNLHLTIYQNGSFWTGTAVYKDDEGYMAFHEDLGHTLIYTCADMPTREKALGTLIEWVRLYGEEMVKEVERNEELDKQERKRRGK